jgi:hypothetical protein
MKNEKKKNRKKLWKKTLKKTLKKLFFGFGHEKTELDRKITRFWCSKKPR